MAWRQISRWRQEATEEKKDDYGFAGLELALGSPSEVEAVDSNLWLGDTGAPCHMTNNKEGLFNQVKINSKIVFGNG